MLNRYLNSDPVSWLTEDSNPAAKYLTKKYILKNADSNDYSALEKYNPVKRLLEKSKNGIIGNINQFNAYYTGSMWLFAQAVYLGLDSRHEEIKKTAEAIIDTSQLSSGGFSASEIPKTEDACLTGLMAGYLIISSLNKKSAESAINWIKANQRHDGGWLHTPIISNIDIMKRIMFNKSGSGLKYEKDKEIQSCVYATSACMNALILDNKDDMHGLSIKKAADFFLKNRLFVNGRADSSPSKIRKNLNPDFCLLSVPFFCQYDILEGLNLMALSGNSADIKISEAFNMVINKQNSDSKWNLESLSPGMLGLPEEKINQPGKLVTLRMINLLNNIKP